MLNSLVIVVAFASMEPSDQSLIEVVRQLFTPTKTAQVYLPLQDNPSLTDETMASVHLDFLKPMGFVARDLWGNRDYIFGYGAMRDGSLLMVAWKNSKSAPTISLKEVSSIYTEERLAAVTDDSGLKRWRKVREEVAGAFIAARKSEAAFVPLYPTKLDQTTGRDSLKDLLVSDRPLAVRFLMERKVNNLKGLVGSRDDPGIR